MTNRGQAMIESLLLGTLIVGSFLFFLRHALRMQKNLFLDEEMEQTLICLVERKASCITEMKQRLAQQGYTSMSVIPKMTTEKINLIFKARSPFNDLVEKESELSYELNSNF